MCPNCGGRLVYKFNNKKKRMIVKCVDCKFKV